MIDNFFALLFHSRDYGHRAHLRTQSHAVHKALDLFYKDLTEALDTLVEAYQGRVGLVNIPYVQADPNPEDPCCVLDDHLKMIEALRYEAIPRGDTVLHNLVDEVCRVYLKALYQLKYLK